jgi:ketosteroid isomerase-like protein
MTTTVASDRAAPLLAELTQVLHAFFHAMDERRYDDMLAMFTDDCRWLRQGAWLEGRSAVGAALKTRAATIETRHVITNAYVSGLHDGSGEVEVEAYMTAYRHASPTGRDLPMIRGALRFNLVTTRFRRDTGFDWRVAEQRMVPAFGFIE